MPQTCSICRHPDRDVIDRALIAGVAFRHIAGERAVSTSALQRHKEACLPATIAKAEEAEGARADDLLAEVRALQARTITILERAESSGKLGTAVMAIGEARRNLELLAKLLGQLDERPTINLLVAPEWLTLRAALFTALQPYPEARARVADRLIALEAPQ